MNQLSGEDIYILPGSTACQGQCDGSRVVCICGIIACSRDRIRAQWDVGEAIVASSIGSRGSNRGATVRDGYRGSCERLWCGAVLYRAGQHGSTDAETCHSEGDCHGLCASHCRVIAIGRRNGDGASIRAWSDIHRRRIDPE